MFLDSVKLFMKNTDRSDQSTFSNQEMYRLKKLMLKVRSQIANDGSFSLVLLSLLRFFLWFV